MRWFGRWWNSRPGLYVVPLFFLAIFAIVTSLIAVFTMASQNATVGSGVGLVLLVILLIALPWMLYQRVVLPVQWLAQLVWRHRSQPLWVFGAVVATGLWLLGFVAIWRVDWIIDLLFIGFSISAISTLYESRATLGAKLRGVIARLRG